MCHSGHPNREETVPTNESAPCLHLPVMAAIRQTKICFLQSTCSSAENGPQTQSVQTSRHNDLPSLVAQATLAGPSSKLHNCHKKQPPEHLLLCPMSPSAFPPSCCLLPLDLSLCAGEPHRATGWQMTRPFASNSSWQCHHQPCWFPLSALNTNTTAPQHFLWRPCLLLSPVVAQLRPPFTRSVLCLPAFGPGCCAGVTRFQTQCHP